MQKLGALRSFLVAATLLLGAGSSQAQDWIGPDDSTPSNPQQSQQVQQTAQQRAAAEDSGYLLGTGDRIKVAVFNEENLSGDFDVDNAGLVRLPMIGTTRVGGLTAHGAEDVITQRLAAGYLTTPRVTVTVINTRPFFILGEVNKPGEYPSTANMNALTAVALAGGFTGHAASSTVYIQRQGQTAEREYPADQRTKIYPGDVVRVDDTVFWRIMGFAIPLSGFRPY